MRALVVGLGIQGHKRRRVAGTDCVGAVDPVHEEADFRTLESVSLDSYDAALVCTPDDPKFALLKYLLGNGKHVLVEKPLWFSNEAETDVLAGIAASSGAVCYTAYNHRFEPHFVRMHDLISSGALGKIYRCRMFYGNGTARLVRDSAWRDSGAGVLPDLGSHLLDTARFWFGDIVDDFRIVSADRFENLAPDHVVIVSDGAGPRIELEMSLLSWRNHFTCDVFAERGTAHIESLCKWGPSRFTHRRRVLPSGRPSEDVETLEREDPTWEAEYAHFKELCLGQGASNLENDRWLYRSLGRLSSEIQGAA